MFSDSSYSATAFGVNSPPNVIPPLVSPVVIDITDQDIFKSLVVFFKSFLPNNTTIVQAQDNLVAMPKGGFVAMNNVGMTRLSFNVDNYDAYAQRKFILTPVRYEMQLDFYGSDAQTWAFETQALFRDQYATDIFPTNIQPLYADDPVQIPLIDGEQQYEQRWKITASLQYNPILTTNQQSSWFATVNLAPIDQTFKP